MDNFPAIGELVLDPNEKFKDENQEDKYDLLLCDGSEVDPEVHPRLGDIDLPNPTTIGVKSPNGSSHYVPLNEAGDHVGLTNRNESGVVYGDGGANLATLSFDTPSLGSASSLAFEAKHTDLQVERTVFYAEFPTAGDYFRLYVKDGFYKIQAHRSGVGGSNTIGGTPVAGELDCIIIRTSTGGTWAVQILYNGTRDSGRYGSLRFYVDAEKFTLSNGWFHSYHVFNFDSPSTSTYVGTVPDYSRKLLPDMTPPDPACPYRIVADLTGGT